MTKLRLRAKVNFPATVTGSDGIGVIKVAGVWRIVGQWEDLDLITTIATPETKELWVKDPATDIYYRMSVDALIDALPQGPSGTISVGTTSTLAGGANATVANSGTSTAAIFDFGIPAGRSAGWKYAWLTSTTNADPAAGNVKGNNATIASITNLYISETDGDANAIAAVLALLDDSTSTVKATVNIYDPVTPTNFAVFNVTGSITDNGAWDTIPVTYVASGGTLTNALAVRITAALSGNKGADGAGTGDFVGPASSVDSEIVLFNSTTGKLGKRASTTGMLKGTSGVLSAGTDGTDYLSSTTGAKQGKQTIFIPASAILPRVTNGPSVGSVELTTNKVMVRTVDFDTTTQEFAQFSVWFPKSWNLGTVTFQPTFSQLTTAAGGVVFGLAGLAVSDGDDLDAAFGTAQTSTKTAGTLNKEYQGPESSAITIAGTPTAGDRVIFQINRTVADASDTLAQDARLHGVRLFFTTNAATDT